MSDISSIPELTQSSTGTDVNNLAHFLAPGDTYTATIVASKELADGKTWLLPIRVHLGVHMAEAILLTPEWIPKQGDRVSFTKPEGSSILRATHVTV